MRQPRFIIAGCILILSLLAANRAVFAGGSNARTITIAQFNYVVSVASSMSHVYFATTRGILRYNKLESRWEEPFTGTSAIRDEEIQRVWVDTFDESLYLQTDAGLYQHDIFFDRWYPVTELPDLNREYERVDPPDDLLPPDGNNYFGRGMFVDEDGRNYHITEMISDQSGNYWIGTWGHGPARASTSSGKLELLPFGLIQERVSTILMAEDEIWVSGKSLGQPRTGITALDRRTFQSRQIETGLNANLPAYDINCLAVDSEYIFVGTDQGLVLIDRQYNQMVKRLERRDGLPGNRIISLASHNGDLYVGTGDGLGVISGASDSMYYIYSTEFNRQTVYDLEPVGGHLWIASSVGAYRYAPGSGMLQRFRDKGGLLFSRVYNIEVGEGFIWFAADGGLVRLNAKTGVERIFQDQSSRLHRRALAASSELAAISTDKGVMIFFIDDEDKVISREFTVDDGIASPIVYALALDGDYLWIGTDRGLTRLLVNDPERID